MSIPRALSLCALALLLLTAATNDPFGPQYTPGGALVLPTEYRQWVFLSSGLDMSYSEHASMQGQSMFDNVFVDPAAWSTFRQTGHWPDKTIFVMEVRAAKTKGSIKKKGPYQTEELVGLEFHVRDESRFKGGWGFFVAEGATTAILPSAAAPCYACHQAHGAVDPIAVKAGTFRGD